MNYIPGFNQHLQQFARGGRARFDQEMIYDADQFEQPMMFDADQQYVDPNATYFAPTEQPYVDPNANYFAPYVAPTEQPYVAPYTAPIEQPYVAPTEQQFVSPRYNGEDIYNAAPVEQPYVAPYTAPTETPYVPGFTNYLETSVPPYVAPVETAAPAAAPAATSVAAPAATSADAPMDLSKFDFSGLAGLDLSGLNFASNFGGGAMGGIYPNDPNLQYINAPVSNKGNPTSQTGNVFTMTPDQKVRLVDLRTNQVVFEGTGYDAARKATELGQGMTDTLGRKAEYNIQTADPSGVYSTVANEKKNKSTLGTIANIAGTALPLAALAVPGLNVAAGKLLGSKLLGSVALGTALGGAGAGLKGDNILKGAIVGGLSSAGGAFLPKVQAIGDLGKLAQPLGVGVGSTVGNLVTGQSLKDSLLSGVASGALAYATPSIQRGLGIGQGSGVDAGGADAGGTPSISGPAPITVTGGFVPSTGLSVGSASPRTSVLDAEPKPIDVMGATTVPVSNVNIGTDTGALTNVVDAIAKGGTTADDGNKPINVLGSPLIDGTSINIGTGTDTGALSTVNATDLGKTTPDQTTFDTDKPIDVLAGTTTPTTGFSIGSDGGALAQVADSTKTGEGSDNKTIDVSGRNLIPGTNIDIGDIGGGGLSTVTATDLTKAGDGTKDGTKKEEILVTGSDTTTDGSLAVKTDDITKTDDGTKKDDGTKDDEKEDKKDEKEEIVVDGSRVIPGEVIPYVPKDPPPTPEPKPKDPKDPDPKDKKLGVEEYLRLLALLAGLADGKDKGTPGKYTPGGGRLNPIFSAKLPDVSGFAARKPRDVSNVDFKTYGYRPGIRFFDDGAPITFNSPPPVTTPVPNDPTGPSMYAPDTGDNTFARGGGAFAAKRGGPSRRTEFAVNGPGTGRSDDIPAVLSDGEYVIDAETVALLGDGSSKAGAKKLDDLRVKVRKHKGQKLAKGRFSANAKKPEAYLSGGRI